MAALALALGVFPAAAQSVPAEAPLIGDWRRIGTSALELGLGSLATGGVTRVWYSTDGSTIFAQNRSGSVFETADLETWRASRAAAPPLTEIAPVTMPEAGARIRKAQAGRMYAAGRDVFRSEDDGANWVNLTRFRDQSILGDSVVDVAVSPANAEEVVAAGGTGVWRSVDGGLTWNGLNDGLRNLPVSRLLGTPGSGRGVLIAAADRAFEWIPGERKAWREVTDNRLLEVESERNQRLSRILGSTISASAASGAVVYAGAVDGRIWSSTDSGTTWQLFRIVEAGRVERIVLDPQDPRVALAAIGSRPVDLPAAVTGAHLLRTLNAGGFWDDLSSNLPDVPVHGVAFDRPTGAIYAATERGLYWTFGDLNGLSPATRWERVPGRLPETSAADAKLDPQGHQLYAAFEGAGVYSAIAPHRLRRPALVSAADLAARPAAPGALITLIGAGARSARAGALNVPLLASSADRTELQLPFEVQGNAVQLTLDSSTGTLRFGMPLETVAPAIFVDRDGVPMVLDLESGVLIDASNPARRGTRVQLLAAGLGRVRPDWPAGVAAPSEGIPAVVAPVRVRVAGVEAEVTRAVLAPGYVGFYLVEAQIPTIMNAGPTDLVLEVAGKESNRVRLWIDR